MKTEAQLRGVADPRLAIHATSSLPAWLWSIDGDRIVWCNPVGARVFAAANATALRVRSFGPADPHRRQVAQLAPRLPADGAIRLERLRGFGAALGGLLTCACARLDFQDGVPGILIAAAEPVGRAMPLVDRLRALVDGIDTPIAAFARDGLFIEASCAARALLGFGNLAHGGLEQARDEALKQGRSETPIGVGRMVLQRVGAGADVGLVAMLVPVEYRPQALYAAPERVETRSGTPPDTEDIAVAEAITASGEAPAEFALQSDLPAPDRAASPRPDAAWPRAPDPAGVTDNEALEPCPRRHPLRFVWQIDPDGRFSIGSDEFVNLIGPHSAGGLGRPWSELAEDFGLDPEGRVAAAVAGRKTWSGITIHWPVDDLELRLAAELSGLPVQDRDGGFAGYRGFGVCRDLDTLSRIAARRHHNPSGARPARPLSADSPSDAALSALRVTTDGPASDIVASDDLDQPPLPTSAPLHQTTPDTAVETPKNVLPFRPANDVRTHGLTSVENSAFNELARQLSARLESDGGEQAEPEPAPVTPLELPAAPQPDWLSTPTPPAQGDSVHDKMLFDLIPVGILIYRLDRLLYANRAFLARVGYPSLQSLEDAGGLDVLFLEAGVAAASSTSESGTPVSIAAPQDAAGQPPAAGHLHTISWDGAPAMALIFAPLPQPAQPPAGAVSAVGAANAEELGAILDTFAEGVVMFDAEGNITCCNRSAEALFGYTNEELARRNLADLVAPESQRVVQDYLESVKGGGKASLAHGREALGRVREGGLFPLAMTIGRTRADGPNFFAVFRDLAQAKKTESELVQSRRQVERAATAKADVLAKISHEIRTPLNAILGFAEVMIEQRFGALGNERYIEYMKDIRASGERVIAIVNDLLDLSRIETGKLDLAFATQDLNDLVEQSVSVMQPQANRERIIIRSSLAHLLPPVVADAQALRQIILNLIGTSIHLANAGGQVIVSTALSDFGEVILRVRDTGHRLNEDELAAAMEPFGSSPPSDHAAAAGVSLSLTKALIEANRGQFHIKTAPHSGTLIEVVFAQAEAPA